MFVDGASVIHLETGDRGKLHYGSLPDRSNRLMWWVEYYTEGSEDCYLCSWQPLCNVGSEADYCSQFLII